MSTDTSTDTQVGDHTGDLLMLPDELLLAVSACALESFVPTIFRAHASCKRLQDLLAQLCTTTEDARRLEWVEEFSLKVDNTNLGSTVAQLLSHRTATRFACALV